MSLASESSKKVVLVKVLGAGLAQRERLAMSLAAGTEMTQRQTAVRDVTI